MIDINWVAGFIDGEGSIMIVRARNHNRWFYSIRVDITQCDEGILRELAREYGGRVDGPYQGQPHHSLKWVWRFWSHEGYDFLRKVLPHLHLKNAQAVLAIKFWEVWKENKPPKKKRGVAEPEPDYTSFETYRLKMRKFNQRGSTPGASV